MDQSQADELDAIEARPGKNTRLVVAILFTLIIATIVLLLSLKEHNRSSKLGRPLQLGLPAPDFTFPDLNGKVVSLSDYRGKVVFINIWATWCPPCRDEMPSMQKLYNKFKGHGPDAQPYKSKIVWF